MRRILVFSLIMAVTASAAFAQNRRKNRKVVDNTDYPAEINAAINNYDVDKASSLLDKWESNLDASGKDYPDAMSTLRSRVLNSKNLLERVENIELIDTLHVDSLDFFRNYFLSANAGELLDASELPDEYSMHNPKVVYRPQNGKFLLWSMPVKGKAPTIVACDVLDDGSLSAAVPLGKEITNEGITDFPFMLEDGATLYFAAQGENSLGGYDIFMTRRSLGDDFLKPQNIGMPYNSPFNDFMMAIDESRNLGWWASDREQIPGKVTIYVFRPSVSRVNHDPDDPDLANYASLKGVDPAGNLESLLVDKVTDDGASEVPEFVMSMGNGKVYTKFSQFRSASAKQSMEQLLRLSDEIEEMEKLLSKLRVSYAKGDKKLAKEITELEKRLDNANISYERLSNKVVSLETGK